MNEFDWGLYPEAEELIQKNVDLFLSKNAMAAKLAGKLPGETSTRFMDWIDHIEVPESAISYEQLEKAGFTEVKVRGKVPDGAKVFRHTKTYLMPILIHRGKEFEIALKPEEIDDLMQVVGLGLNVEGEPFAPFRKAVLRKEGEYVLSAVERRGYDGFVVEESSRDVKKYIRMLSTFFGRQRYFGSDKDGMEYTARLVKKAVGEIKSERVADAFFRTERVYWQSRNRAGQVQHSRQQKFGMGWGNHDHHTFRSSRENFKAMINIWESMGYICREQFYAGKEAGWGAQVMEHPVCEIVLFTDVDLSDEETKVDFAHEGLKHNPRLGTVGLWVGLHGESILQAGMHHLEARFDFEKLRNDLESYGVKVMKPFSDFNFLKQAFTVGDSWAVDTARLDKLLKDGSITSEHYQKFKVDGAIGSHMEDLQRRGGFKGFNKASVTDIITATDPRAQGRSGA